MADAIAAGWAARHVIGTGAVAARPTGLAAPHAILLAANRANMDAAGRALGVATGRAVVKACSTGQMACRIDGHIDGFVATGMTVGALKLPRVEIA